jgi:VWFA-related protein
VSRLRSAAGATLAASLLTAALAAERQRPTPSSADLVELDVVVLDRQDQPVGDLRQEDFRIKEDGRAVDVKTFVHVTALGSTEPDDARVVTLLLDDVGVPTTGTSAMRAIAQVVLSPAGRGDELSVVRLSSRSDEAFGDYDTARDRIAGYRGGIVPFSSRDTPETVLKVVTKIAQQLEPIEHRRKVIICVGLGPVCDVEEPSLRGNSVPWPRWVEALGAAARANVSLYSVDPTGLRQRSGARGFGLIAVTGGERFANFASSNDLVHAVNAIWSDASHYYLLGYWPSNDSRELHTIDVSVARKDVHVRVRRRRGA